MKNNYLLKQLVPSRIACKSLLILWMSLCCAYVNAQENIIYPDDVGIINVVNYGALGNDDIDDTEAIQNALSAGINGHQTVYLPNGTYLVKNTLKWSNGSTDNGGWGAFLSMQGQSRLGTIIKLKDYTFTNPTNPQAVIMTGSRDDQGAYNDANGEGNQAFEINLSHFTVDIGTGNEGAIGIDYQVSNWGALREVTVKSSDPNKIGVCGVSLLRRDNGPGLIEKISIDGFQYGIRAGQEIAQFTLEHITLSNQSVVGIDQREAIMPIRDLTSVNAVPAVRVSSQALLNLLEANLTGGSSSNSAIEFVNNESRGYLRSITTSGYASAVKHRGTVVGGSSVGEWVSDPVLRLSESSALSLNLPIENTPEYFDSNLSNWASVGSPNGSDDSDAIQAAMNSGRSTVYFIRSDYRYSRTIVVPPSVKHIIGMGAVLRATGNLGGQVLFKFEGGSTSDLTVLEKFELNNDGGVILEHASPRTVVVKDIGMFQGTAYRNASGAGKLFISNIAMRGWNMSFPQQVWARQFNVEGTSPELFNNGGIAWILGFKVEGTEVIFDTRNGGKTEAFGGLTYTFGDSGNPAILNENSQVAASWGGTTYMQNGAYSRLVREKSGSETTELPVSSSYGGRTYSVPMYVGILNDELTLYRINAGGFPAFPFQGDAFYSGNTGTYFSNEPIDVSGVIDSAPQPVYQAELNDLTGPGGTFSYTLPDLEAGRNYKVRLHFVERYFTVAGGRVMHVDINGNRVLANYDIFFDAGARNKAVIKEFTATAKVDGTIKIDFTSVVDRALINGIEILESSTPSNGNGTGLTATYFNNRSLSGSSVINRIEATVNLELGTASPIPGTVNNNDFSIRWAGQVQAPVSGNYTFSTVSDDGVRLWVNGNLVIDNWSDHSATTNNSGAINLTANQKYDIRMEFYEAGGDAVAKLLWSYPGQAQQLIPTTRLYPIVPTIGTGLSAAYFNNKTLSGAAVITRVDATVDLDLGDTSPVPGTIGNNDFSIRWSGQLEAPVSGNYTLTTISDDGVRLWLDDNLIIDNWSDHSATANDAIVSLNANEKYNIRMEYYEAGGLAVARLLWAYGGQSQVVIPQTRLYPASNGAGMRMASDRMNAPETLLDLTVYPNPVSDEVTVTANEELAEVRLLNGRGNEVFHTEGKTKSLRIKVSQYPAGLYLIQAKTISRKMMYSKIIIK